MAQAVGIRPGAAWGRPGRRPAGPLAPSHSRSNSRQQRSPSSSGGLQGPRPRGGRAGDEHQVAEDPVGPLGLAEDDPERARDLGVLRPGQEQLGAADDHGQRVVQLVAGAGGELAERVQLPPTQPLLLGLGPGSRSEATTAWSRRSSRDAVGEQRRPRAPGAPGSSTGRHPGAASGPSPAAPELGHGPRRAAGGERDHDARRMRVAPRGRRLRTVPGIEGSWPSRVPPSRPRATRSGRHRRRARRTRHAPRGRPIPRASRPAATRPAGRGTARRGPGLAAAGRARAGAGRSGASPAPRAAWPSGPRTGRRSAPGPRPSGSAAAARRASTRGRVAQGPGGLLGPSIRLLDDRQPVRAIAGARLSGTVPIGVQPGGVDDQRIAAPALGQPASQVVEVRAQVGPLHPLADGRVVLPPPGDQPFRVDRRDRPPSQAAELPRPGDGLRIADRRPRAPAGARRSRPRRNGARGG